MKQKPSSPVKEKTPVVHVKKEPASPTKMAAKAFSPSPLKKRDQKAARKEHEKNDKLAKKAEIIKSPAVKATAKAEKKPEKPQKNVSVTIFTKVPVAGSSS